MALFVSPKPRTAARPPFRTNPPHTQPAVIVLTDEAVKAMFARTTLILTDGVVPVEGQIIGWKRTTAGCLGAVILNPLSGNRFLYGPDIAKAGRVPRLLSTLN